MPGRWRIQTTRLPSAEVEVCWRPMEGDVAGDFHDVIDLRDGRVAIVIGDVAGFGPLAAERADDLLLVLRRTFRHRDDPIEVLRVLDAWVLTSPDELFATLACAVVDVAAGSVHVARAGHPPIALREADGARFVEGLPDPPLGVPGERRIASYPLSGDTALFLYTDGVVERRGSVLDEGLAVLLEAAGELPPELASASQLARRTTERLGPPADDATIVSVRLHGEVSSPVAASPAGAGRQVVRLCAYLDRGDLRSARTEDVVREVVAGLQAEMDVQLEIVDSSVGSSELEAEGVIAVPMVVRVSPPPAIRVVGVLRSAEELARVLRLPLPTGRRAGEED